MATVASLRSLRRRLLRWERYADQVGGNFSPREFRGRPRSGYWRAFEAVHGVEERFWEQHGTWMGGPAGEAALLADCCTCPGCMTGGRCIEDPPEDNRCCNAGDDGHPGPCATTCDECDGGGRCPNCGGVDDMGCDECGGSGSCGECWGQGEHVDDYAWHGGRAAPVETAAVDRGLR